MLVLEDVAVTLSELDGERLWGGAIDLAAPARRPEAYWLDLAGWVLGRTSPVVDVELLHEGVVVHRAPVGRRRPDVAELYPGLNDAERSGFVTGLSVPGTAASVELQLRAVLRDQTHCDIASIRTRRAWLDQDTSEISSPIQSDMDLTPICRSLIGEKSAYGSTDDFPSFVGQSAIKADAIFGVYLVRNEADIIRTNILHHLSMGIDRILVIDNGSTDETASILDELARGGQVEWTCMSGAFHQSRLTTELAREAFLQGADWVIPIDADEFWWTGRGDLKAVLGNTSAGAFQAQVVNFIQRREQSEATPDALLHMTRRAPVGIGPARRVQELVEARQIAFVEIEYQGKWISRASLALEIAQGNHSVTGVQGPRARTDEIVCLHAPLRARSVLESKADAGRPLEEVEEYLGPAWHVKRWRTLAQEGALDQEWNANSYVDDGLDVHGVRHELVVDTRLRDVVQHWIGPDDVETRTPDGSSQSATFHRARAPDGHWQRLVQPGRSQTSEMGSRPEHADPPSSELRRARQRLARQERGIELLREYFQGEVSRRGTQVAVRDRQIRELQEKRDALLAKGDRVRQQMAKRDQRIAELQAEAAALREIQQSKAWHLVNAWWTLRRKLRWPMLRRGK